MIKKNIYNIFNEAQVRKEDHIMHVENLISICEKSANINMFNQSLKEIIKILLVDYEPGSNYFDNIKEFIKLFLNVLSKHKKEAIPKNIINNICDFLSQEPKKKVTKTISIFLLGLFLIPYNKFPNLYYQKTLDNVADIILIGLNSKSVTYISHSIKLLKKVNFFQKNIEIKVKLEELLNTSNVKIKKDILDMLDISDINILSKLVEMHDDENNEIRLFVYNKILNDLNSIKHINKYTLVKILCIGLKESNRKSKDICAKIVTKLLFELNILSKVNSENNLNLMINDSKKDDNSENTLNNKLLTAKEKIKRASLIQNSNQFGYYLISCPSKIFNYIEGIKLYSNTKLNYIFELLSYSFIDILEINDLKLYLKKLIDTLNNKSLPLIDSSDKILDITIDNYNTDVFDSNTGDNIMYSIIFLNYCIRYSKEEKLNSKVLKAFFNNYMFNNIKIAEIINYYYRKEKNIIILHQLLLITLEIVQYDLSENQDLISLLSKLLMDLNIKNISLKELKSKLNVTNPDYETIINENIIFQNLFYNSMVPNYRKSIEHLDDLIEDVLLIIYKIKQGSTLNIFSLLMQIVSDLNDNINSDINECNNDNQLDRDEINCSFYQDKQNELKSIIQDKLSNLEILRNRKIKDAKILKIIKEEKRTIDDTRIKLELLVKDEENTYLRVLKISNFLIKYLKLNENELGELCPVVFSSLKRKDFPEVMTQSLVFLGSLSVYNKKNDSRFIQMFFNQLCKKKNYSDDLKASDLYAMFVIFDSIIKNDISDIDYIYTNNSKYTISDKKSNSDLDFTSNFYDVINKFLYNKNAVLRIITITFISKVIIFKKIYNVNLLISRIISVQYCAYINNIHLEQDFNSNLSEVINNLLNFIFIHGDENQFYSLIYSIFLIFSCSIFKENVASNITIQNNIFSDFLKIKFDYLNNLLLNSLNNRYDNVKNITSSNNVENDIKLNRRNIQKKILLRLLKKFIFTINIFVDVNTANLYKKNFKNNQKYSKTNKILSKRLLKEKASNDIIQEKTTEKLHVEKIAISLDNLKNNVNISLSDFEQESIITNIKVFYEISKYDEPLIGEFFSEDEIYSLKLFSLLHYFEKVYGLDLISIKLSNFYYEHIESKNYIIEINSIKINLLNSYNKFIAYLVEKECIYSKIIYNEYVLYNQLVNESNTINEDYLSDEDDLESEIDSNKVSKSKSFDQSKSYSSNSENNNYTSSKERSNKKSEKTKVVYNKNYNNGLNEVKEDERENIYTDFKNKNNSTFKNNNKKPKIINDSSESKTKKKNTYNKNNTKLAMLSKVENNSDNSSEDNISKGLSNMNINKKLKKFKKRNKK